MVGLLTLMGFALLVLVIIGATVTAHVVTHPPRRTEGTAVARNEPTTPAEAGAAEYATHRLTMPDGREVEVWDVPGHDPTGPIIVMAHGWGDSRWGELLWFDVLMPVASRLILFDLPGHGELPGRCTWGLLEVDHVLSVIEWARERGRRNAVVLLGYSMGAAVAIRAAARAGGKVAAVVADSPYLHMSSAIRGTMRLNGLPTWPIVPMALAWLKLRRAIPSDDDVGTWASQLNAPLLVIHGETDAVTPLADAERIAHAAPKGAIVKFPDCDHLQAGCAAPSLYTDRIRDFLREIPGT